MGAFSPNHGRKKTESLREYDGLASGYTMMASISSVKRGEAREVVVAVPTAPMSSVQSIASLADVVVCLNIREESYFAVADAYESWHDLSEEEALDYLRRISVQFTPPGNE